MYLLAVATPQLSEERLSATVAPGCSLALMGELVQASPKQIYIARPQLVGPMKWSTAAKNAS